MSKQSQRTDEYAATNPPLGCSSLECAWRGTSADLQGERQIWIQACTDGTRGKLFGPSDKTRQNSCQAKFDAITQGIRFDDYSAGVDEKAAVVSMIGKDNPVIYLGLFLFVGLIIYLLMS